MLFQAPTKFEINKKITFHTTFVFIFSTSELTSKFLVPIRPVIGPSSVVPHGDHIRATRDTRFKTSPICITHLFSLATHPTICPKPFVAHSLHAPDKRYHACCQPLNSVIFTLILDCRQRRTGAQVFTEPDCVFEVFVRTVRSIRWPKVPLKTPKKGKKDRISATRNKY